MKHIRLLLCLCLALAAGLAMSVPSAAEEQDVFLFETIWTDEQGRQVSSSAHLQTGEILQAEIRVQRTDLGFCRYGIYGMEITFTTQGLRYLGDGEIDPSVPATLSETQYTDKRLISLIYYDMSREGVWIDNPVSLCTFQCVVEDGERADWRLTTALVYSTGQVKDLPQESYYELHLDPMEGTIQGNDPGGVYLSGTEIVLPAAARKGYAFQGWSDGTDLWAAGSVYRVERSVTLTAQWKAQSSGGGSGGGAVVVPPEVQPPNELVIPVPPSLPAESPIHGLNLEQHVAYMVGYPDGRFGVMDPLTRAEAVTVLYRLLLPERRDEIFTTQAPWTDVPAGAWYRKAVASMGNGSYVTGYPDGTFAPMQPIRRAEFIAILARFTQQTEDETTFSDVPHGHWAYRAVATAEKMGWIVGDGTGRFRPDDLITRAEAVTILNRMLNRGISHEVIPAYHAVFSDNLDPDKWYYYEILEATTSHTHEGDRGSECWLGELE